MKEIKILLITVLLFLNSCSNGDYTKKLGGDYTLERTNACCIFVFKGNVHPTIEGNTVTKDTRIIKPVVKELFINDMYIVGLKVDNQCCYLSDYEKKHNTPNGYFIINKNNGEITAGLKKSELAKYNIKFNKMKKIL